MEAIVYHPAPVTEWKGPIVVALPAFFVVGLIISDDLTGRLIFLAFFGAFLLMMFVVIKYFLKQSDHPLKLDPNGIAWQPFLELYGVERIPWSAIDRMDLFRSGGPPAGVFVSLRIFLREGDLSQQIKRPLGEQLFGGDVNVPLSFDATSEEILETARKFHRQFGNIQAPI